MGTPRNFLQAASSYDMVAVNFLHDENPPAWAGVEPTTLGAEGQRQTNHATQPAFTNLSTSIHSKLTNL
ncbi:hypothetical protein TNCV_3648771 [Trichonephila clavipes]|nr:hypothetical protein TNCV_3648771 [Trichonephila clavipes]